MKPNQMIYILMSVASFSIDKLNSKCKEQVSLKIDFVNLLHHFISIYLWFGAFIGPKNYPEFHFFFTLLIMAGWNLLGNCFISIWVNKKCGFHKDENHKDLTYFTMSYITNEKYQSYSILTWIILSIDIIMIGLKYKIV